MNLGEKNSMAKSVSMSTWCLRGSKTLRETKAISSKDLKSTGEVHQKSVAALRF